MDIGVLKNELDNDPLGRDYASLNDVAAAADLNTAYRTRTHPTITSSTFYEAIDSAEFDALSDADKTAVRDLFGLGELSTENGSRARATVVSAFGGSSTTVTALLAAITESVTRGEELGIGRVKVGHVQEARTS